MKLSQRHFVALVAAAVINISSTLITIGFHRDIIRSLWSTNKLLSTYIWIHRMAHETRCNKSGAQILWINSVVEPHYNWVASYTKIPSIYTIFIIGVNSLHVNIGEKTFRFTSLYPVIFYACLIYWGLRPSLVLLKFNHRHNKNGCLDSSKMIPVNENLSAIVALVLFVPVVSTALET